MNIKKFFYYLFLIGVFGLILINVRIDIANVLEKKQVFDGSKDFPGGAFLPFHSYLKDARKAGYYSDYAPVHPDTDALFAYFYQRAQFALAPTVLDHTNPWKYDYIVLCLYHPSKLPEALNRLPVEIVAQVNEGIILLRQRRI